jgi:hypothetical protein
VTNTSYQPTRSQHLMLAAAVAEKYGKRSPYERIIVHYVLKDTPMVLHLQIERQCPEHGVFFERVYL